LTQTDHLNIELRCIRHLDIQVPCSYILYLNYISAVKRNYWQIYRQFSFYLYLALRVLTPLRNYLQRYIFLVEFDDFHNLTVIKFLRFCFHDNVLYFGV
jgi:hypothetical protein